MMVFNINIQAFICYAELCSEAIKMNKTHFLPSMRSSDLAGTRHKCDKCGMVKSTRV